MIRPSLDVLMNFVDSKYTLVSIAAKRAREMTLENELLNNEKPITAALEDIASGTVTYKRMKEPMK